MTNPKSQDPSGLRVPPHDDAVTVGEASVTDPAYLQEIPGARIGPYKLLQLIGEGGFGSVFMAEQEKPVKRRVALKIIKLGMDTAQVVARFEQERQALAILDHPCIAKIFDAGATETGRPYFAMELCPGEPIDTFCDRNRLGIEDRLTLFADVCAAVQHAHTKGIIHRDIKPTNILVSMQDGRPRAKVIDFGIAKAFASKLTDKTLYTQQQQLIGTLEYMSPEQAEGSMDIDTRTDIYALGVVLYELLTGSTPFSGKELRSAAFGQVQRILRDVDPPRPSTRLSESTGTIDAVAASRGTEPRQLGTALEGELDWIVMKAIEKDRTRRYETANGFAADIGRYLRGEAVVAAPPSSAYRIKTFVRRHKILVGGALAVAATLLLGVVGTSVGIVMANRQRANALAEAARATEAERTASARLAESEATVTFLDDMLGAADPLTQGKDVTVRRVLDEASKSMGTKFDDRPLVAARLHATIGRTYAGLGEYAESESHLREALAIRQRELGLSNEETRRTINDLGSALIKAGKHSEADALLTRAIADNEKLFGRHHPITLQSIDALAVLYAAQSRSAEAAALVREVLDARLITPGKANSDTVASMNTLATMETDLGRFDEAEKLYLDALATQEKLSGPDHPLALELKANLAWMLYWAAMQDRAAAPEVKQQRLQRSRELGERLIEARTRVLGPDHPETLTVMNNLSSTYRALGMRDKALALSKAELEISIRVLGEEHPDTITSIANMGAALRADGKCLEALPYLERAVRASRKVLTPDNPGTAYALGWYGSCLSDLGRFSEAEPLLLEARAIAGRSLGEDHNITRQMTTSLVLFYSAWNKAEPGKGFDAKAAAWEAQSGTDPANDRDQK